MERGLCLLMWDAFVVAFPCAPTLNGGAEGPG